MKQCQHCHKKNQEDAIFCEYCGEKFKMTQQVSDCPRCHHLNDEGAKFCEACGFNLEQVETRQANSPKDDIICSNCHHKNESSALFCEACGISLAAEDTTNQHTKAQNEEQLANKTDEKTTNQSDTNSTDDLQIKHAKTPLSKNQKIGIGAGVIIAVVAISGFMYMKEEAKPLNQLDSIVKAIKDQDSAYLVKHMTSSDQEISFTDDTIKPMLDYFSTNQEALSKLQTELSHGNFYEGFYLTPNGKTALFFTKYDLGVETIDAVIETNTDNTTIYLNDEAIAVTEDDDIMIDVSQLIPGTYQLKAIYEPKNGEVQEQELTYDLIESAAPVIDLSFHLVEIPIKSNLQQADILVNGKKVGTLIDGNGVIGPLSITKDMLVKLKNKDTETKEVPLADYITDYGNETLYLNSEVAVEEDVLEGLTSFYDDFAKVVQSKNDYPSDAFAMSHFVQGRQNSAFSGINDYIKWCRERSASNEYGGVTFDIDVTKIEPLENQEYTIDYSVTYNTTYPASTKKDKRIETFDYSGATIQLQINEEGKLIHFAFVNMGDGGVKVADNKANE